MRYDWVKPSLDAEIVIISFLIQPAICINLTTEVCGNSTRSHIMTVHTHAENGLKSPVAEIIITRVRIQNTHNIIYI